MLNTLLKMINNKRAVYFFALNIFFISIILAVLENKAAVFFLLSSLCLILLYELLCKKNEYSKKNCIQFAIIYSVVTVSIILAIQNSINIDAVHNYMVFVVFLLLFANTSVWIYRLSLYGITSLIKEVITSLKTNIWMVALSAAATLMSIDTIKNIPIWDDYAYLYGIEIASRWSCNISDIKSFFICKHVSFGYSFFTLLGAWLVPNEIILGIRIVQIILTITALLLLYTVIQRLLGVENKSTIILFCCSITFFPVMLGMQGVNPDYYMLCFLIIAVCCNILELKEFELFFSFCLCFSKEPGAIVYVGYCMGRFLYRLLNLDSRRSCGGFRKSLKFEDVVSIFLVAFWVVVYKVRSISIYELMQQLLGKLDSSNMATADNAEAVSAIDNLLDATSGWDVSNGAANEFMIDVDYIKNILLQLLTINFIWIPVVIGLVVTLIYALNHKRKNHIGKLFTILLFVLLANTIFLCVYVTYPLYRYKMLATVCIVILSGYMVCLAIDNEMIKRAYFLLISALFLAQSYLCVDPITNNIGRKFDTGNGTLISTDKNTPLYISNNIMINHQGYEWLNFIQEVLREIDYNNQEKIVLIAPETEEPANYRSVFGIHYIEKIQHWEEKSRRIKVTGWVNRGEPIVKMALTKDGIIYPFEQGDDGPECYDKKYVLNFPFIDDEEVYKYISNAGYEIAEKRDVSYRTWKMEVIRIE